MRQEYKDECPYYLDDFITNLSVVKDRTDRTIEAYFLDIRTFLRYLNIKHRAVDKDTKWCDIKIKDTPIEWLENFTLNDSYVYLKYLADERKNSIKTRARKCSAMKQLYIYLSKKAKLISTNPVQDLEMPHINQALPKYLSLKQSIELLKNIDSKNQERDYCIITLFLNCGMRLSELVGLNINDYSADNHTLRLFGKGRKERIVYLNDACIDALDNYLENVRPKVELPAIFLSSHKTRINKRRVQQIVEEQLKRAGLSNLGISTHKLRHTAATLMYQYGDVDTLVLKDILGHKSIATTEIYTHLSNENVKKAMEANPLADIDEAEKKAKNN